MSGNIIFMTALKANDPNMFDYMEWSLKSWEWWAKKNDVEIFILDEPLCDTEIMRPTWQRWYVYDILKQKMTELESNLDVNIILK